MAALNEAVRVGVAPQASGDISGFRYECSSDGGATWPVTLDVASVSDPTTEIDGLTNGTEYVCRAFAENTIGSSDASADLGPLQAVRVDARVHPDPRAVPGRPRDRAASAGWP